MPVGDLEKELSEAQGAIFAKTFSLRLSLDYRSEMRQSKGKLRRSHIDDVTCPKCHAGFQRIERRSRLSSLSHSFALVPILRIASTVEPAASRMALTAAVCPYLRVTCSSDGIL